MTRSRLAAALTLVLVSPATAGADGSAEVGPAGLIVFPCEGCPWTPEPSSLLTIRPDGTGLRYLPRTVGDTEPEWSPDGRRLAVTRAEGIWLRLADGSRARRLTRRHPQGYDAEPSWSPGGRWIVFDRGTPRAGAGGYRRGLWVVATSGGRARPLLVAPGGPNAPEWSIGSADWSPDGRRIAFSFGSERLRVIRADGTGLRSLGPSDLRGREPRWSPDGRSVAFFQYSEGARPHRFRVLDLASGRVHTVFSFHSSVWAHTWSPDGRKLAIAAARKVECETLEPSDDCESLELWIVDASGATRQRIYAFGQLGGEISALDWRAPLARR